MPNLITPASTNKVVILTIGDNNTLPDLNDLTKIQEIVCSYDRKQLINYLEDLNGKILGYDFQIKIWNTLPYDHKYVWRVSTDDYWSNEDKDSMKNVINETFSDPELIIFTTARFLFQRIKEDLLPLFDE